MLDNYIDSQSIAYKMIKNQLNNNLINHAYIIETNGDGKGLDFAKCFAKSLLCPFNYTNFDRCISCCQCSQIEDNNFIEFKIIEPNGMWITKGQIEELQTTFMKKAIVGSKKVYIINHFEKMKPNVMDSLLKFIEEPVDGVIALLITDNINNIIDTIVSRCQIIHLHKNYVHCDDFCLSVKNLINSSVDINLDYIESAIKFVVYYELNKKKTLLFTKSLWFDIFKDSNLTYIGLYIVLLFYKDCLNLLLNKEIFLFKNYNDDIIKVANLNSIYSITDKISILMDSINKIKYNANLNLLIDKLIIDLEKR